MHLITTGQCGPIAINPMSYKNNSINIGCGLIWMFLFALKISWPEEIDRKNNLFPVGGSEVAASSTKCTERPKFNQYLPFQSSSIFNFKLITFRSPVRYSGGTPHVCCWSANLPVMEIVSHIRCLKVEFVVLSLRSAIQFMWQHHTVSSAIETSRVGGD